MSNKKRVTYKVTCPICGSIEDSIFEDVLPLHNCNKTTKLINSAKEAKELSIKIWSAIVKKKVNRKINLPTKLWSKIKDLHGHCPLCEWYCMDTGNTYIDSFGDTKSLWHVECNECPLAKAGHQCEECANNSDYFSQWFYNTGEVSNNAAKGILDIIRDWEI